MEAVKDLATLESGMEYVFQDKSLLVLALTHSSWANEHGGAEHNERLEFLGDAVLELNVSEGLYRRFPGQREGTLTRLRSRMVSEISLAQVALAWELHEYLLLGRGEETQGGRRRASLLADAVEAVLGSVYLDGGPEQAARLVARMFASSWPTPESTRKGKDYKTRLQEWTQARFRALPVYVPLISTGPEHAKLFAVRLDLPNGDSFQAEGPSLKRAEQNAAQAALCSLNAYAAEQNAP